jgi:hypothetical protein
MHDDPAAAFDTSFEYRNRSEQARTLALSPITTNRGHMTSSRDHERPRRPATSAPAITKPAAPADAA